MFLRRGTCRFGLLLPALLVLGSCAALHAQTETNSELPGPGAMSTPATNAPTDADLALPVLTSTHAPSVAPPAPAPAPAAPTSSAVPMAPAPLPPPPGDAPLLAALLTFASLGGFLLYQCGLARASNCGHTCALLLLGVVFALAAFGMGGFAVEMGGVGDTHAALAQPLPPGVRSALDHELGFVAAGHHWGLMGNAGFFLATDEPAPAVEDLARLFLVQAAFLALTVAAALGAALDRGKLVALTLCAFLAGAIIFPTVANWAWGGGWLAELGREFGLGHGFVDLAGAGVVHETAGTLALVLAVLLRARQGRFARNQPPVSMPGHNLPFVVLGSLVLLVSWTAANAFAGTRLAPGAALPGPIALPGLAAIDTLLAALGGTIVSFLLAAGQKRKPEPALLCRGLLGGAAASGGGAGLFDPWAAFVIGAVAGLLVPAAVGLLERRRIDDPAGTCAIHGAGGAWGVLAVGLFANGAAGYGVNGVPGPVRGIFWGGGWHQLAAQGLGAATLFATVFLAGLFFFWLVQKIVGLRVTAAEEIDGLDFSQTGAYGYRGDGEAGN